MRPVALLAAALLLAQAMAGCADPPEPAAPRTPFDPQWSEIALETGDVHDHEDPAAHANRTTRNFRILGHDALDSDFYGGPPGATFCGDAQQMPDGRRIAAAESRSRVGFTLVDVTDPADPRWLGELVMENTRVYDLAVVPDGRHVVLVTQDLENLPAAAMPPASGPTLSSGDAVAGAAEPGGPPSPPISEAPPAMVWRSPCTGGKAVAVPAPQPPGPYLPAAPRAVSLRSGLAPTAPAPAAPAPALPVSPAAIDPIPRPTSILLVDISDPAQPAIVDHHPLYGNGHSAFSTILDGRTWVLATTTGPSTPLTAYETTSAFEFYEIAQTPAGSRLNLLSIYKPQPDVRSPQPPVVVGPRGHDAWIAKHPVTGATLAYLAAWERMEVLDLADPRQPRLVGQWTDVAPGREGYAGEIHSVLPLPDTWEGRHYTIIGPELKDHPIDHPTGILWVLDTTDVADPFAVAGWTLPHEVEWAGEYMFSNHYYAVVGKTLVASMYHGGVWAIDLSPLASPPDSFRNLDSIGVFLPVAPGVQVAHPLRWAPTVEEVLAFDDGTMVTFDGRSGVWTFSFDAADPAPAPEPWPLAPPPDALPPA